jgi:hypothetical protein
VDDNDEDDDDTNNNNSPPCILLNELVGNEDSEEETEVNNESTGVHDNESTGVHDSESTGVHDSESTGVHDNEITGVPNDITNNNESTGVPDEIADDATGGQEAVVIETITDPTEGLIQVNTNEEEEDEVEPNVAPCNPDTWKPSIQRVYGLCPRKGRECSHLHATIMHHAMPQYSLKRV